jgi:hypothetical protein
MAVSGCGGGSSHPGLANSDIPSDLALQSSSIAFNTVAGGRGFAQPLPIPSGGSCPVAYHQVFIPAGKAGEASQGEGVAFTYPEILTIGWKCRSATQARSGYGDLAPGAHAVTGVGVEAAVLSVGDVPNQGFPHDHVYIVKWRQGNAVGALDLVGRDSDTRITPSVAESLARLEASNA